MEDVVAAALTVSAAVAALMFTKASPGRKGGRQAGGARSEPVRRWREAIATLCTIHGKTALDMGSGDMSHWAGFKGYKTVHCADTPEHGARALANVRDKVRPEFKILPPGTFLTTAGACEVLFSMTGRMGWLYRLQQNCDLLKPGGFMVVATVKPELALPYVVKDEGDAAVLDVRRTEEGLLSVTTNTPGGIPQKWVGYVNTDEEIEEKTRDRFWLAYTMPEVTWADMSEVDKQFARAFRVQVFMKKHVIVQGVQRTLGELGITGFNFAGGVSFTHSMIRNRRVCPLWLLWMSDIDVFTTCPQRSFLTMLQKLNDYGVPIDVARYRNVTQKGIKVHDRAELMDLNVSITDTVRSGSLYEHHKDGMLTDGGIGLDTILFLYLGYTAFNLDGGIPYHSRGFKMDRLLGRAFGINDMYMQYHQTMTALRHNFYPVTLTYGPDLAKRDYGAVTNFYKRNAGLIDELVRAVFAKYDVLDVAKRVETHFGSLLRVTNSPSRNVVDTRATNAKLMMKGGGPEFDNDDSELSFVDRWGAPDSGDGDDNDGYDGDAVPDAYLSAMEDAEDPLLALIGMVAGEHVEREIGISGDVVQRILRAMQAEPAKSVETPPRMWRR